jgi:sulfopropanediol 3-dehydrogenase
MTKSTNAVHFTSLKSAQLQSNSSGSSPEVRHVVGTVIADIRERGDDAVREFSEKFDKWSPKSFLLSQSDIDEAIASLPTQVIDDILFVQEQVRHMAQRQKDSLEDFEIETLDGVFLGQKNVPITRVGAYIPGGKYPLLASAHMTIVTAKVAGVDEVIAMTPPLSGEVPKATVAAMHLAGADKIYLLGGVQAVAAMAVGTETITSVDMIAGPGNAFVAEAKRQLFGEVGIDLFAGPTEILIVADDNADPFVVAVDLLSQAEHGPESPAILITTSEVVAKETIRLVDKILPGMPTKDFAEPAWRDFGQVLLVDTLDEAYRLADDFASEHVQILTDNPREALEKMRHYGALFLGEGTCVSYGDKTIGTNHVLPTMGAARYTGGLWVGKYLRTVTYQEVTNKKSSSFLGDVTGRTARVENFEGHARSGDARAWKYGGRKFPWIDAVT